MAKLHCDTGFIGIQALETNCCSRCVLWIKPTTVWGSRRL